MCKIVLDHTYFLLADIEASNFRLNNVKTFNMATKCVTYIYTSNDLM
jgi:hypothetical protein